MRIDIHAVIAAQPKGSFNLRIPELLIDEGQMVVAVGRPDLASRLSWTCALE